MRSRLLTICLLAFILLSFQNDLVFGDSGLLEFSSAHDQVIEEKEPLHINSYDNEILGIALPPPDGKNGWYTRPFFASAYISDEMMEMKYVAIRKNEGPWVFGKIWIEEEGIIKLTAFGENARGRKLINVTTVKVDFTPPEASIVPTGKQGKNDWFISPVDVEVQGWDALSGLDHQAMAINNQAMNSSSNNDLTFEGRLPSLRSSIVQDGIYLISTQLFDRAGNSSEFELLVKIDLTQPQLKIERPKTYFGDIRLQGSFHDGPSGVKEVFVDLGEGWFSAKKSGNQWCHVWKTSNKVADGKYTLRVRAIDQAGNESIAVKQIEVLNNQWPFVGLIGVAWALGLTSLFDPRVKVWKGISEDIHLILWRKAERRNND